MAIDFAVIGEVVVDEEVCLLCGRTPCFWTQHGTSGQEAMHNLVALQGQDDGKAFQYLVVFSEDYEGKGHSKNEIARTTPDSRDESSPTSSEKRKYAYSEHIRERYGSLGEVNRLLIPQCIAETIRRLWPNVAGSYLGSMTVDTFTEIRLLLFLKRSLE